MTADGDPSSIRSIAVSATDVVDAYVYGRENPGTAVLRATPPFHGRMRARIHVYHEDDARVTGAVHVSPDALLEDDAVANYPTLEDKRADASAEETDRIRKRHAEAVDDWRERARGAIVDATTLETDDGPHAVDVKTLDIG
ncbi:hypothetical protein [Natronococcus occultus]|uniref:DUF8009 domain-containing protein n=1 Tax=Natronococcus occultus SP4 TaxID=694430 RepID=L0JY52_9EURY|nr:hypothetical protein [Natronococcus occultus]AGB37686.1 hypothetical protein Natoc_1894 [Natronococcus occultus SP4]